MLPFKWRARELEISATCALIRPKGVLMVRSLITAMVLNLVMQVATPPLASAQIEMALDDVIVIDPALCGVTGFTPPEPIPTVCQKHAELGQTRGFLSD